LAPHQLLAFSVLSVCTSRRTVSPANMRTVVGRARYENYGEPKLKLETWQELDAEGNSLRYEPSQYLLAVGSSDGTKTIHTVPLGKITSSIPGNEQKIPITCVKYRRGRCRWRPQVHSKNKVLLVSDS